MSDLEAEQERWRSWITEACAAVGVDPSQVDIHAIHGLTKRIAHNFDRPMAPVGAYILGLAVGAQGEAADLVKLRAALESTFR